MQKHRSDHQLRVDEFMQLAAQELPEIPTIPSEAVLQLRANLMLEETLETIAGLGFKVVRDPDTLKLKAVPSGEKPDIIQVVDGCADVKVVTTGTLSAFGVADMPVQLAVDRANLRKFGPGSYRREDGKWVKPPDFVPPDIMKELVIQGWKG